MAGRVLVFILVDTLCYLRNSLTLVPNFVHTFIEKHFTRNFGEWVSNLFLHAIKIKLPMHILILYLPLDNALVLHRCGEYLAILEDFNTLDHTRMSKETSRRRHLILLNQVKLEVNYFEFFDSQSLISE